MEQEYVVFVRFSLNGDDGALLSRLRGLLVRQGFERVGTSAYEKRGVRQADTGAVLSRFWRILENPAAAFPHVTFKSGVHIDHVWTHVFVANPDPANEEFIVVDDAETFEIVDSRVTPPAK